MKILIDTNVLLDVFFNRELFVKDSLMIFKLCESKLVEGNLCAISIPNIVYIMRKELSKEKTNELIKKIILLFNVVDLKSDDLLNATKIAFSDYEDALQAVTAKRIKADYIVTRNLKDYINSEIVAITPNEMLKLCI